MNHRFQLWRLMTSQVKKCNITNSIFRQKQLISTSIYLCNQNKEEMEHLKTNPYFDKYAAKLKQKEEEDPNKFEAKVEELEQQKRDEEEQARASLQEAREKQQEKITQRKAQGLGGVMKVDLLEDKSAEEITAIWTQYHSKKDCIYAVIPKEEYEQIYSRSKEFSVFLYPLPRGTGYEFMVQQFDGHDCHFTPLIMYQRHQENAPPCLTLAHYTDLIDSKGIVLMNSEVNKDIISIQEAQLLALQLKMYYGVNSGLKFNLVRTFKNAPAQFRHMDVVKEFEKYKQDVKDHRDGTWV